MDASDTPRHVARKQAELLRAAGTARRGRLMWSLTAQAITASRNAIAERHPDWTEREVKLEWARLHYGDELAAKVRAYLAERE